MEPWDLRCTARASRKANGGKIRTYWSFGALAEIRHCMFCFARNNTVEVTGSEEAICCSVKLFQEARTRCHWVLVVIGISCAGYKFAGLCQGQEVHLSRQNLSTATCRIVICLACFRPLRGASSTCRTRARRQRPCSSLSSECAVLRLCDMSLVPHRANCAGSKVCSKTCCHCYSPSKVVIILPG